VKFRLRRSVIGKLNFTWRKPNFTGIANFTFAEQKFHFAKNYHKNYRTTDIKNFLWLQLRLNTVA
jgi:hypothetical protein